MKKTLTAILLATCITIGLTSHVVASAQVTTDEPLIESGLVGNPTATFTVPEGFEFLTKNTATRASRSTVESNVVTAQQVMEYNVATHTDPEQKRFSQDNLESGEYIVEFDGKAFVILEGDINIAIKEPPSLARAQKPFTKTGTASSKATVITKDYGTGDRNTNCKAVFEVKGKYKYGYNGQLFFLQADGAPTIKNTYHSYGIAPFDFPSKDIKLGVASTSGGGNTPTLPTKTLKFSARPQYYYMGWCTQPVSANAYYG